MSSALEVDTKVDAELRLWLVLIGAMLADRSIRDTAAGKLTIEDVPQGYRDIWGSIINGDRLGVRAHLTGWGTEQHYLTVFDGIVRKLQETTLSRYVRRSAERLRLSAGITPEQFRESVSVMLSRLDAREAALIQKPAENPQK